MIHVHFDGACEPRNPGGTMGCGIIIYDGNKELWRGSAAIPPQDWPGTTTSNVAEYIALLTALAPDRLRPPAPRHRSPER